MTKADLNNAHSSSTMFTVVGNRMHEGEKLSEKSVSFWKEVMLRFSQNKLAILGLIFLRYAEVLYGKYMRMALILKLLKEAGTI